MTELRNTFHNTTARTRRTAAELQVIRDTEPYRRRSAERALVRRLQQALCGIDGCCCGGEFGERE